MRSIARQCLAPVSPANMTRRLMVQSVRLQRQFDTRADLSSVLIMLSDMSASTLMSSADLKGVCVCSEEWGKFICPCTHKCCWTGTPLPPFDPWPQLFWPLHAWVVIIYNRDKVEICLCETENKKKNVCMLCSLNEVDEPYCYPKQLKLN